MARKKSPSGKAESSKEFTHSPFSRLKGLSASGQAPPAGNVGQEQRHTPKTTESVPEDPHSFSEEMQFLGVKPLAGRGAPIPEKGRQTAATGTAANDREERDRTLFLEALGEMTSRFPDDQAEEHCTNQAAPRRLRQVARGQLKPEEELDLHGLTLDEALTRVRFFLDDARYRGVQTVLVITGKGLHSSDGPVLRQAVEKLLAQLRDLVLEWGSAPRNYGGDGALVVFLRRRAGQ